MRTYHPGCGFSQCLKIFKFSFLQHTVWCFDIDALWNDYHSQAPQHSHHLTQLFLWVSEWEQVWGGAESLCFWHIFRWHHGCCPLTTLWAARPRCAHGRRSSREECVPNTFRWLILLQVVSNLPEPFGIIWGTLKIPMPGSHPRRFFFACVVAGNM